MKFICKSCGRIAENENVVDYLEYEKSGCLNEYCSHFWEPYEDENDRIPQEKKRSGKGSRGT